MDMFVAFDFDGTIRKSADYGGPVGEVDFSGITKFHEAGYAVAIMTCNDVGWIASLLRENGFAAKADRSMTHMFFPRGMGRHVVLVTGRKVAADFYVDDKGYRHCYGDSWDDALAECERRREAREFEGAK